MSAKQSQITTFFSQNKKQKKNKDSDGNSTSVNILSTNLNEIQGEIALCADMLPLESSETSTLALPTASSSTLASLTSPSSTSVSLTSPSSRLPLPTSPSSTLALSTSPSSTLVSLTSPSSVLALPTSPSSTLALPTSSSSTLVSLTSPSSTLVPLTSPSSTLALPTSSSSALVSLTSPSSILALPTSPSSTLALPTSSSSTLVSLTSPSSILALPTSPSSTSTSLTSPSSTSASTTTKLKCEAICCTSNDLYVPRNQSDFKLSSDKRSCQLGWFLKYQWLTYCQSENKVYCYFCRTAYYRGFHPEPNKSGEAMLAFTGFSDWKNAIARLKKHESSKIHSDCVYLVKQQPKPTVAAQLNLTHQIQQAKRRRMLLTEIQCIKYLLRQGLAIRGHVEDEANLIQLLKLRASDVDGLAEWLKEKNYLSHDVINEICQLILSIISERKIYSIICDETRDESGKEQLCFTIRSVDNDFIIYEDVLGMYMITSQSAADITKVILDIICRCNLDIKDCRGQGYDGAPSMAGHISGVAARIQRLCSKAFFVHCNAHSLDLTLQDLTSTSSSISTALNITNDIINFIKDSPKRLNLLDTLTDLNNYTQLKPLCPHRWTVRASSINSLLINYSLVKTALTEIGEEGGHPAPKANGLTEQMDKFSTYFGLKLGEIKTDEYFMIFFQGIQAEAKSLTDEPFLPRPRKPPLRFTNYLPTPTRYETIYDFYHYQYFEVINKIIDALDSRFKQSVFPLLCNVEKFILSVANITREEDTVRLNDIKEFLVDDIDIDQLERELTMLPDYFSTVNKQKNLNLKRITKISTICELLNIEPVGKNLFCEYRKLLLLYLTIPTTTATAERSFSALNRIKTHLRCTMTQQRLNHVIIPHIHKEKLDLLDLNRICSEFISKNQNRKNLFGHE
ncbi:unnamed protein product [Rotaria sordida]|uniref:TTF-type domain-containing protein n=1 Tax=Rotaria sordida TaxID=392033 RepID=A0A819VQF2_9BILA|nr:unnamed protein product [Rotaria sordida]CAF4112553.1 unnamed protein product [Rotaria sordida]